MSEVMPDVMMNVRGELTREGAEIIEIDRQTGHDVSVFEPYTFERYEEDAIDNARMHATVSDMRAVLKSAGFRGFSKMKRAELLEAIERDAGATAEFDCLLHGRVRHFRWKIQRAVSLSYAELADIEARAGVVPMMDTGPKRGEYGSWEDVRKVFEAAQAGPCGVLYAKVRVSARDEAAIEAVAGVLRAAGARFAEPPHVETWDDGERAWYIDLALDKPNGRGI